MPDRSFLEELKHRKVYRVAAIYAGVAFIVWQVADIALPTLGAPPWVMQLIVIGALVGFPIALVLAWLVDLAPGAERRLRIALVSLVGVVLVGGAVALLARVGLPGGTPDPSARTLAVMPFHVRGSEGLQYLRDGLVDLLSRNLQVEDLHPIDPSAVMKAAEGEGDAALTPDDATRLARSVGAGQYVLGTVNEAAGRLRIHAVLYELGDSLRVVSTGEVDGDTLELFAMVDELTAELLAGRSSGEASRRVVRTAATTTSSLPALKRYLEGERSFRTGEHVDAVARFGEALEADSTFALARFRMAMSHALYGAHASARREIELLTATSAARLGDHDRRVLAAFAAHESGRLEEAERLYRAVVRDFPADVEAKVLLASLITTYATLRGTPANEAAPLLNEIEALDPEFLCISCMQQMIAAQDRDYERLAELKLRLEAATNPAADTTVDPFGDLVRGLAAGDTALIDSVLGRAEARWTDDGVFAMRMLSDFFVGAMLYGQFELAERFVAAARARGGPQRAIDRRTYEIAVATGRRSEASDLMARRIRGAPPGSVQAQAREMLGYAWLRLDGLDGLRERLIAWEPSATTDDGRPDPVLACPRLLFLGLLDSRVGDPRATAWADSLDARARGLRGQDSVLVAGMAQTLRADLAWRAGDAERAYALLERVTADVSPDRLTVLGDHIFYAADLRAFVALDAGRFEEALRWFRYGGEGLLPSINYGDWHLGMARTLDGLGRRDEAAEHYARVVDAWQDADPELAAQRDYARTRLAAIRIE